jgi:ABC-type multidrug transport system permease subunit
LEEEIESTTGRLKYLSDLVDYSTLNLTLTEPKDFKYKPVSRDKFTEKLKQSISKGWYGFMDFLLFIIKIWPFWIIVAVVILFWNNIRKKKRKVQKH